MKATILARPLFHQFFADCYIQLSSLDCYHGLDYDVFELGMFIYCRSTKLISKSKAFLKFTSCKKIKGKKRLRETSDRSFSTRMTGSIMQDAIHNSILVYVQAWLKFFSPLFFFSSLFWLAFLKPKKKKKFDAILRAQFHFILCPVIFFHVIFLCSWLTCLFCSLLTSNGRPGLYKKKSHISTRHT